MRELDLEKAARESTRWYILKALDAGRPYSVGEDVLLRALVDSKFHLTPRQIRIELDYLADRKLIDLKGKDEESEHWEAELTAIGVDVVEYTVPCNPGIARPPKR